MKKRKLGHQIIGFFILTSIINVIFMFGWFAFKTAPVLEHLLVFKDSVSLELKKEYSNIDELKNTLKEIAQDKHIIFRIEDANKNIIVKEETEGITLFSDFTTIGDQAYFISFMSRKNINFSKIVLEGFIFQVIEVTLLFGFAYLISRRKILKPIESGSSGSFRMNICL